MRDVSIERIVERFKLNVGSVRISLRDPTYTLSLLLKDRRQSPFLICHSFFPFLSQLCVGERLARG